ncbi:MAG TPA: ATP-binding protein [Daejeonella sp.]|nr:ATP-binding protein [Daejeonella sp.]
MYFSEKLINNQADPEEIYRIVVEEASILAALYTGPEITIKLANKLMLTAWDKDESIIGKTIREANPEWEGQPFFDYFDTVYRTGVEYVSIEEKAVLPLDGVLHTSYYNFNYKPLKHPDGTVWGIVHTALDVSEQVRAKKAREQSDVNFRNMIDQSPVAMGIYKCPDFVLSIVNPRMLEFLGKTEEQVINKQLAEGVPEIKDQGYEETLQAVYTTGIAFEAQEQAVTLFRNGALETVYVNYSYTPIKEGDGNISGILAVAVDVSDQVRSKMELKASIDEKDIIEQNLREERERLTLILQTMAEGVGIVGPSGKFTYVNPMAQKILGIPEDEILLRTFNDPKWKNLRVDGTALPDGEHPMAVVMSTGKPVFDYEISTKPHNSEQYYVSVNAAAIKNESGEIVAGIQSFMDVTHRRKAIQQKDEFISVASHELKTPLTSLNAGFQLLERQLKIETNLSDKFLKIAATTRINLRKLSRLVEDLLNSTKIENGHLKLQKSWFTVSQIINECCDQLRLQGNHELKVFGDLKAEVFADEQKIDQVLTNFVNNAVKYAPGATTIELLVESFPDKVKVSVVDTGIGIEPEKVNHIFNRFYQVDPNGMQFSGLGLGLYISSEIIKQHGGQIGVESELGKGSTFWFTIPGQQRSANSAIIVP